MITVGTRTLYTSPEDDIRTPLLAWLAGARRQIRFKAYSFSDSGIVDILKGCHSKGIDVSCLFDVSQYESTYDPMDKTHVDELRAAGIPCMLTVSPKSAQIDHDKFIVLDGLRCQYGSANYTRSAGSQTNHVVFDTSRGVSKMFLTHWQTIYDFNRGKVQP